jgi:ABC-2 type transport system permease protein
MYVVFGLLIKLGSVEHYPVYLLLGIILWTFFAEATNQGLSSIVARGGVIRKVSFPKYIIVISTTISALVNLIINLGIVGIFMLIGGVQLHWSILMLPIYLLEIYIIALGLAFSLSTLNVKYRDTSHIWEIIMQAAFYGTPIIYPLTTIMTKSVVAAKVLMMNPVAQAIQDARYSLVTHQTITVTSLFNNAWYMLIPLTITAVVFIMGALYFKKNSKYFAENV